MANAADYRLVLKSAELSGNIESLQRTMSTLPDAGFAPAPLTEQFSKAVAKLTALGAMARTTDPASPESQLAREMAMELQPKLFATGGILFTKSMRANPESEHNAEILGHLALLKHRTPAQTNVLNKSWLMLAQYHALRGSFDKSAQVAQDAIASESPFATGETNAQNQLTAAAIWNGRGKSPFGQEYDKARREQFIRQTGYFGAKGFITGLTATTATAALTVMGVGATGFTYMFGAMGGISGGATLVLSAAALGVSVAAAWYASKAVINKADRLIRPIAPQVMQAKRFTISKVAGASVGVVLGLKAAFALMGAIPEQAPEPVYYKKQSPQREEKRDDWQKSAKFKLLSPASGHGPRSA